MSQQEFVPREQTQEQLAGDNDDTKYEQPYYPSTKSSSTAVPKDEPAASYDEPMIHSDYQAGYTAQDYAAIEDTSTVEAPFMAPAGVEWGRPSPGQVLPNRQQFGSDGDAYENAYRPQAPGNAQWVPPWARPQRQPRGSTRFFWLIILGLVFIGPALHLLFGLLAVAAVIVFSIALPFLFFGLFAMPFLILRRVRQRRWRSMDYWRGPGAWRR